MGNQLARLGVCADTVDKQVKKFNAKVENIQMDYKINIDEKNDYTYDEGGNNYLNINYDVLTHDMIEWIRIAPTTGPAQQGDFLHKYLIDAYITFIRVEMCDMEGITTTDIIKLDKHITEKFGRMIGNLDEVFNTAGYTTFCRNFFGTMTSKKARTLLEYQPAPDQCELALDIHSFGDMRPDHTKIAENNRASDLIRLRKLPPNSDYLLTCCYICNQPLGDGEGSDIMERNCEHILPVSDALFHLNLVQDSKTRFHRSTTRQLNRVIIKEYRYAHECCNIIKTNDQWIIGDNPRYAVNNREILTSINNIHAGIGKKRLDCEQISKIYPDINNIRSHDNIIRICNNYIQPIVNYINGLIVAIGHMNGLPESQAFIVYNMLSKIRFLSRISGPRAVAAFRILIERSQGKDAIPDPSTEILKNTVKSRRIAAEEVDQELANIREKDERKINKRGAPRVNPSEMEPGVNKEITDENLKRISERKRGDTLIAETIVKKEAAKARRGGSRKSKITGGYIDEYAWIQNNIIYEQLYVFLLAYYPVYLKQRNVAHATIDEYLSNIKIIDEVATYFNRPQILEYLHNTKQPIHSITVSTTPTSTLTTPKQNFNAFFKALNKSKYQPRQSPNSSLNSSPYQLVSSFGGKLTCHTKRRTNRRTKKHAKKRRTRKN